MRLLISAVCLGGALLLIAASMLMNWSFWTWQGTDALNGRIFGTVSLGIDVFKCTLPLVIAWAWAQHFRRQIEQVGEFAIPGRQGEIGVEHGNALARVIERVLQLLAARLDRGRGFV